MTAIRLTNPAALIVDGSAVHTLLVPTVIAGGGMPEVLYVHYNADTAVPLLLYWAAASGDAVHLRVQEIGVVGTPVSLSSFSRYCLKAPLTAPNAGLSLFLDKTGGAANNARVRLAWTDLLNTGE